MEHKILQELNSNRYLMNNILLQLFEIQRLLEPITTAKVSKIQDANRSGNDVMFDLFSLTNNQYTKLVEQYGSNIVNSSCVKLENYMRVNNYMPYKSANISLRRIFIPQTIAENNNTIKYEDVTDKDTAIVYIKSKHSYLRDIGECKDLKTKYNIKESDL